jgi:ribosomal-protein-alanine N-acetyltransferase
MGHSRMTSKDSSRSKPRLPVLDALRSGIGGIIRLAAGKQEWKMHALETGQLRLRAFDASDLKDIGAWEDFSQGERPDEQAQKFLDYCLREYRERGIGPWGLELKKTKSIIGNIGFPHIHRQCGEVNCYVALRHRQCGFAQEALRALFEFGFREIGLNRIQARSELTNIGSQRLAERAGMRFERYIEDAHSAKGATSRQKMYVIFRREFFPAYGVRPAARQDPSPKS